MKTPQEIYEIEIRKYLGDSFITPESLEGAVKLLTVMKDETQAIYNAMEVYGKQQYNQAIDDLITDDLVTDKQQTLLKFKKT